MVYSKEFFALQIDLAKAVAALVGLPIDQALRDYTNIYIRFGLGRHFDHGHPVWRRYIDGLTRAADVCDWTYRFYLAQRADSRQPETSTCFSYVMQDATCVRIHFRNAESATTAPLSSERLPARLAELRTIFDEIKRDGPHVTRVVGTSWLYNLPAYRRCFPAPYVASGRIAERRYRHISLWGQFLDRTGSLRPNVTQDFKSRLAGLTKPGDLGRVFPLQALAVEAPIEAFYRFYGISADG
ncbi:hypothetical protein [Paraburkholderia humisilvae]|uniref:Uncharacterized protein n=1 Tax=Paraburkholderia humisilvae TaxID=627669 RepID=A0A6J5D4A0_9BURK|nr:hypothetical protein [Paraburkholderia humisilvae]CAB3749110.1 hypothetical protein LMG29542_00877 [Paraburkholderia humisilvae]